MSNLFSKSKMKVYAVVSIAGGHDKTQHKSPVDSDGNKNPNWNFPIKFTIDATAAEQNQLTLIIKLRCRRSFGDRDIGDVHVPVKSLLDDNGDGKEEPQFVKYQVRKSSGKLKGEVEFSYKFGEKVVIKEELVTAYPPGHPVAGSGSDKGISGSYGALPPAGYPVQGQPGNVYPPQQMQKTEKIKASSGTGMGMGFVSGLLIADMINNIEDCGSNCGGGAADMINDIGDCGGNCGGGGGCGGGGCGGGD